MKANILRQHGIKFSELSNGTILASNCDGANTYTDITNFSISDLYEWLGY